MGAPLGVAHSLSLSVSVGLCLCLLVSLSLCLSVSLSLSPREGGPLGVARPRPAWAPAGTRGPCHCQGPARPCWASPRHAPPRPRPPKHLHVLWRARAPGPGLLACPPASGRAVRGRPRRGPAPGPREESRGGPWRRCGECPHPRSVSTRRDRRPVPHRFPPDLAGLESRGGPSRGAGVRERVRRLGRVPPHDQPIVTTQATAWCARDVATPERCRWPSGIPRDFKLSVWPVGAVGGAGSAASQVSDAGCQPGARAAHHRYYRHSWTRGACSRSRLGGLPAHTASRAHPRRDHAYSGDG